MAETDVRAAGSAPSLPGGAKLGRKKSCVRRYPVLQEYEAPHSFPLQDPCPGTAVYKSCALPAAVTGKELLFWKVYCIQPTQEKHYWDFLLMIHLSVYLSLLSPPTSTMDSAVKGNVCISKEGMAGN